MGLCLLTGNSSAHAQDSTQGDCSPIVKNIGGNVNISCSFEGQIPVFKFSAFADSTNAQQVISALSNFVDQNKKRVFELDLGIDSNLGVPSNCNWLFGNSNRQCRWSSYAYNSYITHQNEIGRLGQIDLVHFDNDGLTAIIVTGQGVMWQHGAYAVQGYFYVKGTAFGQGSLEINLGEITKRDLLTGGRYNLQN